MSFDIRVAESEEDWDFFFRLSFDTLKTLRKTFFDQLVKDNLGKSDDELLKAHRKEMEEYSDFKSSTVRVFIAESNDGTRCGYLWMGLRNSEDYWDFQRPQWIYDIVVVNEFRGKGLGKKLMRKAEEFATEFGVDIGLFVHEDNKSAIRLYETEGYLVKCIPMSRRLPEDIADVKLEDISIRKSESTDEIKIRGLGLKSFKNMVFFSKDVSEYRIITKYEEFLGKFDPADGKHCKYVAETSDNRIVGYIWIGVASFNEKIGNVYDFAVDHEHKDTEVGKALITQAESWSKENGLLTSYFLLHTDDDISQETLSSLGYGVPGYFMEKDLSRTI